MRAVCPPVCGGGSQCQCQYQCQCSSAIPGSRGQWEAAGRQRVRVPLGLLAARDQAGGRSGAPAHGGLVKGACRAQRWRDRPLGWAGVAGHPLLTYLPRYFWRKTRPRSRRLCTPGHGSECLVGSLAESGLGRAAYPISTGPGPRSGRLLGRDFDAGTHSSAARHLVTWSESRGPRRGQWGRGKGQLHRTSHQICPRGGKMR